MCLPTHSPGSAVPGGGGPACDTPLPPRSPGPANRLSRDPPPPLPLLLFRPPPALGSPPSHPLPGNFLVPFLTTPGNQWSLEERGLRFHLSNSNVSGDSFSGMRLAAWGDFTFCFVLTFSAVVAFPARSLSVSLSLSLPLSLSLSVLSHLACAVWAGEPCLLLPSSDQCPGHSLSDVARREML